MEEFSNRASYLYETCYITIEKIKIIKPILAKLDLPNEFVSTGDNWLNEIIYHTQYMKNLSCKIDQKDKETILEILSLLEDVIESKESSLLKKIR